jgi:integrase
LIHSKVVVIGKRKKGMTTHYIRGSTIWINYYVDGKRFQKSTKLKNTSKNINVVLNQIIPALDIKIATGDIYKKKPKTFEYYGYIFLQLKESNKNYWMRKSYWMRVIDYFRGQNIDNITRLDIKEYLISLNMKTKSKSIYKHCIKEIFELAIDDGILLYNPAQDIKEKPDRKEPIQFYSKEEVNKLLSVANGVMKPYLLIAFNTGMRVSEILGLQIADFKEDGYIHVKRTRSKGFIGTGKTNNAIRKVPYPAFILDHVKAIQPKDNIYIFGSVDDASLLRSQWRDVNIDAELVKHKLSSTRHTFATIMLKDNIVSINELAGLLGHSSPKVTLEHYASVIESKNVDLGVNFSLFNNSCGDTTVTIKNKEA